MKKFLSIALAAVMLLLSVATLASCSKDENTLVMATNAAFPPYEYKDGDKFAGIDVEIAEAIAEKLGMKSNQFYAISKSCGAYTPTQLIKAFQLSASVDSLLKTGQLPADKIIDYMILHLLGS